MEKKDTRADKLSGGQKRKLSVAIALIGNPKVIREPPWVAGYVGVKFPFCKKLRQYLCLKSLTFS